MTSVGAVALSALLIAPPAMHVAFEAPSGWTVDDADADSLHIVQLYGPWARRLDHPKITVYYYGKDSTYRTQDAYLRAARRNGKSKDGGRDVEVGEATVGKAKAKRVTFSYVDALGVYSSDLHREPVRETLVLMDAPGGGFFVFQYWAAQAVYGKYYTDFEKLLSTAKPTTPK